MKNNYIMLLRKLLPIFLIVGGFLVGNIFEKIIISRLKTLAKKTKWEGDDIVIASLHRIIILWSSLLGLYLATFTITIKPQLLTVIHKILLVLLILSATLVLSRLAVGFVKLYSSKTEGIIPSTSIFTNFTRILIFVVGLLIVLQTLGISITPVLTALGVGGLAVALALQDTLTNLFSGLHILVSRQIKPNDYIRLETGEEGYVVDISWRNTTIKALPNNMIVIPNSKLASTIVTNYYLPEKEMAVLVQVGVSYNSNLEEVEKVTIEVAKQVMKEVQGGVPEFEPFIRYHTFADFSINFTVILRAKEFVDQYLIKHEFIKRLHKTYSEKGIEIPFPIRTVIMKEQKNDSPQNLELK